MHFHGYRLKPFSKLRVAIALRGLICGERIAYLKIEEQVGVLGIVRCRADRSTLNRVDVDV